MPLIDAVCYVLAVWRVSSLVTRAQGPWQVFTRLRSWLDPDGVQRPGSFGELITCLWCFSVWSAVVLWFLPVEIWYVLACSSAVMGIDRFFPDENETQ